MIISYTKHYKAPQEYLLNLYPNQMVSDNDKTEPDWIKTNLDYFYNVAIQQFTANKKKFVSNYELVKGILKKEDFYETPVQSFTETLVQAEDLPSYVKHYSILTPAINTLLGELSKRPDNVMVKAFDEDSKAEELQYKTQVLQDYIMQQVQQRIASMMAMEGEEVDEELFTSMTQEQVEENLVSYTSMAERWGSRALEGLKARFNIKEKSEEAFRDLLISGREFFHIYEDNSNSVGLNVEVLNPKNVWYLTTPDKKYISDPLDKNGTAYAAGTIEIMELSEILNKFQLTDEEVEHLRSLSQQAYLINSRESNLVNPKATGTDSVTYDVYDPLVMQYRLMAESELKENRDDLNDFLGITNNVGVFGNKYMVVRSYWCSKKKIGLLSYVNEEGDIVETIVDENYKAGTHPQEQSLEWGWINQWYQGVKIGIDIYYCKPLEILDYCPIIGSLFEIKNTEVRSLVDLMKPFQIIYNIAINQLFRLLEKDLGVVFLTSIRHIPVPKDGDYQDALEIWETEAREKGIVFIDDSPENLKAPSSFNQHTVLNMSRAAEIEARYKLAVEMRNECWKLVGLSEQRLGGIAATETATATNAALTQSYAQTEPWFTHHSYTLNKFYQALLDAAQYIESNKDVSTLSFLSTEGEHAFIQVNGSDLKLRDLWVFVTDRSEDSRNLNEIKALAQAMLQNGATPSTIGQLYTSKSLRKWQDSMKKLEKKQEDLVQQQQQIEQQKLQQQEEQFAKTQQLLQLQEEKRMAFEAYQAEQDRLSKERIAQVQAAAKDNAFPDTSAVDTQSTKVYNDYQLKLKEITQRQQELLNNTLLEKEKLQVKREEIKANVQIAKENKNASDIKAKKNKKK